jgi:2-dehydropantoate 2-reductase
LRTEVWATVTGSSEERRWAILGSGALGSVFGGRLALAGNDVTLIDPYTDHMDRVASEGLVLRAPDGSEVTAHPRATPDPATVAHADVVIVLTKSWATRDAAASFRHAVDDTSWVVTLQNGLGAGETLAAVFGPNRVVPGATTVGGELLSPGHVLMSASVANGTAATHLGAPAGRRSIPSELEALASALTDAGLSTQAHADAPTVIWTKLAMAASSGPLSAVLDCTVAELLAAEEGIALLHSLVEEIVAVAVAEGVELDMAATWDAVLATLSGAGSHRASMAVDLRRGRRTEIDAFSVAISRRAEAHGLKAPLSQALGEMIRLLERRTVET